MRPTLYAGPAVQQTAGFLLSDAVHQLLQSLSCITASSNSTVVNNIDPALKLAVDENQVMPVLSELLTVMLNNARNGRMIIHAGRFRDVVMVEIEERNNYNGYALAYSVRGLEPLARMIGGYITIRGAQQLHTTVTFSFPDRNISPTFEC